MMSINVGIAFCLQITGGNIQHFKTVRISSMQNAENQGNSLVKMTGFFTGSYVDKAIYNVLQFGYTYILEKDVL